MLDTGFVYNPISNIGISAVSGTIIKSHPKSFFAYAQFNSEIAKHLDGDTPLYHGKPVVVLQSMCAHEKYMMYELMKKDDFEKAIGVQQ